MSSLLLSQQRLHRYLEFRRDRARQGYRRRYGTLDQISFNFESNPLRSKFLELYRHLGLFLCSSLPC